MADQRQLRIPGTEVSAPKWVVPEENRLQPAYTYGVSELVRVVDGDTFWLLIDLGDRTYRERDVRLLGCNCPESNRKESRAAGIAAKEATKEWFATHKNLVVKTVRDARDQSDSLGRFLATVRGDDSQGRQCDLATYLIATGHAVPFMQDQME